MWLGGVWSRCGLFEREREGDCSGNVLREVEILMIVLLYDELIVEKCIHVYPSYGIGKLLFNSQMSDWPYQLCASAL